MAATRSDTDIENRRHHIDRQILTVVQQQYRAAGRRDAFQQRLQPDKQFGKIRAALIRQVFDYSRIVVAL